MSNSNELKQQKSSQSLASRFYPTRTLIFAGLLRWALRPAAVVMGMEAGVTRSAAGHPTKI
ncbi:hypothetical protein [uncultured Marinobacter sp.]|uniref:hypothetical protein n=1 Tax=uncultured Marinobacter sp. TaxID=187379 RepID=UPI0026245AB7|nr:hypothetical protein [uncultured Marinobacter sp.]